MCAIFGWVGSLPTDTLEKMASVQEHRGPDGYGEHLWDGGAMGMNRLAIVDAAKGGQPFYSASQGVAVVCNGEIYNWRELRTELEAIGHTFLTQCDVEVLPAAWQEWGEQMLQRLNGMFALAVRDDQREGVFLARDRFGQKPLYYSIQGAVGIFSSEPAGLFEAGVPRAVNESALPEYLLQRYVVEPKTLFQGVFQLPAGHCGWLTRDGFASSEWRKSIAYANEVVDELGALEKLEAGVAESVAQVCHAEVPAALYLSGGVDSGVLLGQLLRQGVQPVAITAGFGGSASEAEEAESIAEESGLQHHTVHCEAADLADLPRVVAQMQVPVGDALIVAFDKLAAKAAGLGCKVAYGGDGVDELFQGYSFQKLHCFAEKVGPLGRLILSAVLQVTPIGLLDKVSGFPASLGAEGKRKVVRWLARYSHASDWWKGCGLRTLFEPVEIERLMGQKVSEPQLAGAGTLLERHAKHQYEGWLQDWSIVRQDRNAMAHSLEYRMPFLADQVVQAAEAFRLRDMLSFRSGKRVWRHLAKTLRVRSTTSKLPFYYPVEDFIEGAEFQRLMEDCLAPEVVAERGYFKYQEVKALKQSAAQGEFIAVKKLVALIVLELWMRSWIDQKTKEDD